MTSDQLNNPLSFPSVDPRQNSRRNPTPPWGGFDALLFLVFSIGLTWSIWTLFFPSSSSSGRPGPVRLRPDSVTVQPDLETVLERIRKTPPAKRGPSRRSWRPPNLSNRWRTIVIHHSATLGGTEKSIDQYHRYTRHMENGLAYHFLIGNGSGISDGLVVLGQRWKKQLDGGHVDGGKLDRVSIGICLIGNFEQTMPSVKQIASLKALINYLRAILPSIRDRAIKGHKAMPEKNTECPGTYLPIKPILRHRFNPRKAVG